MSFAAHERLAARPLRLQRFTAGGRPLYGLGNEVSFGDKDVSECVGALEQKPPDIISNNRDNLLHISHRFEADRTLGSLRVILAGGHVLREPALLIPLSLSRFPRPFVE